MRPARRAVAWAAAVVLTAAPATRAQSHPRRSAPPESGRCVNRVRDEQRTCVKKAIEKCRQTFEADLVACWGKQADCPKACIAAETKCRTQPQTDEGGCKLACTSDQKTELDRCGAKADLQSCRAAARVRALKCKQKCTADAAPALQECIGDFDACLTACGKPTRGE